MRSISQIAKDFGISESCLRNWLHAADVADGAKPGMTKTESAELRGLKRRNKLLEQENEVLRRAAACHDPRQGASVGFGGVTTSTASDPALDVLHRVFGYDAFRGEQAAIIDTVVRGGDAWC